MRKALAKRIEVEPLSDLRWARIERALFASPQRRGLPRLQATLSTSGRRIWRTAMALAFAQAVAIVLMGVALRMLDRSHPEGPMKVETAASALHLELGDSSFDVSPWSALRMTGDDPRGTLFVLENGRVEFEVAPRRTRPPLVVLAGLVEVRVVGTHFAVTRSADSTSVDVQHGIVEVLSEGRVDRVGAGEHWPPSDRTSSPWMPAAPVRPASSAASTAVVPSTTRPAGASAPGPRSVGARDRSEPASRDRFETASALESRQPELALAIYRELLEQGGVWAPNALFAEGRLQSDRGNRESAHALLREYLTRYPSGANAEDARRLLERMP